MYNRSCRQDWAAFTRDGCCSKHFEMGVSWANMVEVVMCSAAMMREEGERWSEIESGGKSYKMAGNSTFLAAHLTVSNLHEK